MSEAIATTKRKLYKALDNISNPPGVIHHAESSVKRVRRSASSASTVVRKVSTSLNVQKKDGPPPNFSPWSHDTFVARLKTFSSVSLWHPKPEPIGEVQWAKRGWVCIDVNTVACKGGCGKRVVLDLQINNKHDDIDDENDEDEDESEETKALQDALVQRFESLIIDGHAEGCLWRRAGCKDDIHRLQVVRPAVWQPELRRRFNSLAAVRAAIHAVNTKGGVADSDRILPLTDLLRALPIDETSPESELNQVDSSKALDIALHGWHGSADSGNHLLQCDACFQRIGLWMYQPDYQRPGSSSGDDEGVPTVELLDMHRDHCPWRNADSQKATGSLSGLNASQILHRVVTTYVREQRRRSDEQRNLAHDEHVDEFHDDDEKETLSKEEVAKQDKERESRLRRLKNLFTIKRRPVLKLTSFKTKH